MTLCLDRFCSSELQVSKLKLSIRGDAVYPSLFRETIIPNYWCTHVCPKISPPRRNITFCPLFATSRIFVWLFFSLTWTLMLQWRTCKLKVLTNQFSNTRLHINGQKKNLPPPSMVNYKKLFIILRSMCIYACSATWSRCKRPRARVRVSTHGQKYCVLAGILTQILNVYDQALRIFKVEKGCCPLVLAYGSTSQWTIFLLCINGYNLPKHFGCTPSFP